jgi:hypothetical protein
MTRTSEYGRTGAPLLPPVIAYTVLTICGVALPALIVGFAPWKSDAAQLDFFQHHVGAVHVSAFFTFGAAVPFAIATAVATTRLRLLGLDVPGRIIAQVGGTAAAALLAVSGLTSLALTQDHVADSPAVVRALAALAFAAGGPGFVVFQGLLLAGVSVACLIGRMLPRWLGWAGIVIAVVSELATLSVAFDGADFLLPIGRFGGLAWLIALGVLMPANRRQARAMQGIVRAADAASAVG